MKNIHIINGPNLNLLGKREPEIYGHQTFEEYFEQLKTAYTDFNLHYFQSNHEGVLIDYLHQFGFEEKHAFIINAGAYTHTSIALADAISGIQNIVIEVHISNIHARESFRHHSYLSAVCKGSIVGFGLESYELALQYLTKHL